MLLYGIQNAHVLCFTFLFVSDAASDMNADLWGSGLQATNSKYIVFKAPNQI